MAKMHFNASPVVHDLSVNNLHSSSEPLAEFDETF